MAEPKVRFKKDDGSDYPAWKEKTLREVGKAVGGVGFPEKYQRHKDLPIPFYKVSDMNTVGNEIKMTVANNYVSNELLSQMKAKPFDALSIIFAKVGAAIFFDRKRIAEPPFVIDNNMMAFAPLQADIDFQYLYHWFTSIRLSAYSQVGALPSYNAGDIESIQIFYPCFEEQQKIADFLSSVDDVISTSEQEVANLETQKKAVMKKIFSQEVRFKRADRSKFPQWEEKALGELAEFSKGQGYTKSDLSDTGYPIILYGRLYTKYQTVISSVDTFADMKPRSVLSKKGDVIVPASGETAEDISVAAVVDVDGIILGGDLNIIHPCDAILPDYLAYALTFGTPHQEMAKRAQGKSIVHLHNDDLKSAVIVYPCLEEQRLITDFLSDFDEAISAAKKELDLWKELKKGLLQQMFV